MCHLNDLYIVKFLCFSSVMHTVEAVMLLLNAFIHHCDNSVANYYSMIINCLTTTLILCNSIEVIVVLQNRITAIVMYCILLLQIAFCYIRHVTVTNFTYLLIL